MTELIGLITTILAISGVILNNHRIKWCFIIWGVSNILSAFIHADACIWSLFGRDMAFFFLAVHGWIIWSKKENESARV